MRRCPNHDTGRTSQSCYRPEVTTVWLGNSGYEAFEFIPASTGEVDYALFVEGAPIGVIEAKRSETGENITVVEGQSARYAGSALKYVHQDFTIRFAYEATDKLVRFTDYKDIKFRSRTVFSFHRQ